MSHSVIEHVSDTAFLVAQCRAAESERADSLFSDPWASVLAGDKGKALAEASPRAAMTLWVIAIRTVVIDGLLQDALADGVDTILNLGAGLDARPFRMKLPRELTWIDVDYPDVVAFTAERLASARAQCTHEQVGLDLADLQARRALLTKVGAQAKRLLVLTEGLVPYLDLEAAANLADDLRAIPTLQSWIVDYNSPESHRYRRRAGVTRQLRNAPLKFQPSDYFAFFAEHGWKAGEVRYLPPEGIRLGRPAPLPRLIRALTPLLERVLPAEKRFSRSVGYVRFVPSAGSSASRRRGVWPGHAGLGLL